MTPEQYSRLKQLYHAVQEIEPENRAAFLAANCNGDGQLHNAVKELLESSAAAAGFIERAAYEVLSESLVASLPNITEAGKRIGAYKILREINHGGMGTVYLAERADDIYQKQVAIKILRGGFYSAELRRRFYDERKILARLDHPNITKLLDGGTTDDGMPYYVMDFVAGVALNQYCEQNALAINERLELFRKVCAAVQYAHRNLVIHRDLKPSNIIVDAQGIPQLLDFGIAKVFQDEESAETTRTNLRVMTPEYASPEQITGQPITTASDIYSLGIILHELLTGTRPFHFNNNSLEEIIRVITKREPPRPSQSITDLGLRLADSKSVVSEVSPKQLPKRKEKKTNPESAILNPESLRGDLDNIVLKSLCKEPERRYTTVEQFSEDIRRHLAGLPILARPDTFRYRSTKFVQRNKIGVGVAAGVLLLLIAGAIAILRQTQIAARAAQVSAEERNRAVREQAKAERINKFFQEMLAFANPSWYAPGYNKSRDVTVAQALDEAARKIESDLNEEPEIKAEILLTIGDTYASLARFEQSERALELALKLYREVHGESSVKFADALYFMANTKRGLKKDRRHLRQLYEQANAIYSRHTEKGNQFPYFLLDYAASFSEAGDHAEAIRITKEAVAIVSREKGETNNAVAIARSNLATAYSRWGDIESAFAEVQAAYEIMKPPAPAIVLSLGRLYFAKGDLDKAEPLFLAAARGFEQGNQLGSQASALISLAYLWQERGDNRKAEDLMAQALTIDRRIFAPNDFTVLSHLATQGLVLTRSGKLKQGETLMLSALNQMSEEQRKLFDVSWAECLLAQKRYAEAEPIFLNQYRILKETQHPASPTLKKTYEQLQTIAKFK